MPLYRHDGPPIPSRVHRRSSSFDNNLIMLPGSVPRRSTEPPPLTPSAPSNPNVMGLPEASTWNSGTVRTKRTVPTEHYRFLGASHPLSTTAHPSHHHTRPATAAAATPSGGQLANMAAGFTRMLTLRRRNTETANTDNGHSELDHHHRESFSGPAHLDMSTESIHNLVRPIRDPFHNKAILAGRETREGNEEEGASPIISSIPISSGLFRNNNSSRRPSRRNRRQDDVERTPSQKRRGNIARVIGNLSRRLNRIRSSRRSASQPATPAEVRQSILGSARQNMIHMPGGVQYEFHQFLVNPTDPVSDNESSIPDSPTISRREPSFYNNNEAPYIRDEQHSQAAELPPVQLTSPVFSTESLDRLYADLINRSIEIGMPSDELAELMATAFQQVEEIRKSATVNTLHRRSKSDIVSANYQEPDVASSRNSSHSKPFLTNQGHNGSISDLVKSKLASDFINDVKVSTRLETNVSTESSYGTFVRYHYSGELNGIFAVDINTSHLYNNNNSSQSIEDQPHPTTAPVLLNSSESSDFPEPHGQYVRNQENIRQFAEEMRAARRKSDRRKRETSIQNEVLNNSQAMLDAAMYIYGQQHRQTVDSQRVAPSQKQAQQVHVQVKESQGTGQAASSTATSSSVEVSGCAPRILSTVMPKHRRIKGSKKTPVFGMFCAPNQSVDGSHQRYEKLPRQCVDKDLPKLPIESATGSSEQQTDETSSLTYNRRRHSTRSRHHIRNSAIQRSRSFSHFGTSGSIASNSSISAGHSSRLRGPEDSRWTREDLHIPWHQRMHAQMPASPNINDGHDRISYPLPSDEYMGKWHNKDVPVTPKPGRRRKSGFLNGVLDRLIHGGRSSSTNNDDITYRYPGAEHVSRQSDLPPPNVELSMPIGSLSSEICADIAGNAQDVRQSSTGRRMYSEVLLSLQLQGDNENDPGVAAEQRQESVDSNREKKRDSHIVNLNDKDHVVHFASKNFSKNSKISEAAPNATAIDTAKDQTLRQQSEDQDSDHISLERKYQMKMQAETQPRGVSGAGTSATCSLAGFLGARTPDLFANHGKSEIPGLEGFDSPLAVTSPTSDTPEALPASCESPASEAGTGRTRILNFSEADVRNIGDISNLQRRPSARPEIKDVRGMLWNDTNPSTTAGASRDLAGHSEQQPQPACTPALDTQASANLGTPETLNSPVQLAAQCDVPVSKLDNKHVDAMASIAVEQSSSQIVCAAAAAAVAVSVEGSMPAGNEQPNSLVQLVKQSTDPRMLIYDAGSQFGTMKSQASPVSKPAAVTSVTDVNNVNEGEADAKKNDGITLHEHIQSQKISSRDRTTPAGHEQLNFRISLLSRPPPSDNDRKARSSSMPANPRLPAWFTGGDNDNGELRQRAISFYDSPLARALLLAPVDPQQLAEGPIRVSNEGSAKEDEEAKELNDRALFSRLLGDGAALTSPDLKVARRQSAATTGSNPNGTPLLCFDPEVDTGECGVPDSVLEAYVAGDITAFEQFFAHIMRLTRPSTIYDGEMSEDGDWAFGIEGPPPEIVAQRGEKDRKDISNTSREVPDMADLSADASRVLASSLNLPGVSSINDTSAPATPVPPLETNDDQLPEEKPPAKPAPEAVMMIPKPHEAAKSLAVRRDMPPVRKIAIPRTRAVRIKSGNQRYTAQISTECSSNSNHNRVEAHALGISLGDSSSEKKQPTSAIADGEDKPPNAGSKVVQEKRLPPKRKTQRSQEQKMLMARLRVLETMIQKAAIEDSRIPPPPALQQSKLADSHDESLVSFYSSNAEIDYDRIRHELDNSLRHRDNASNQPASRPQPTAILNKLRRGSQPRASERERRSKVPDVAYTTNRNGSLRIEIVEDDSSVGFPSPLPTSNNSPHFPVDFAADNNSRFHRTARLFT